MEYTTKRSEQALGALSQELSVTDDRKRGELDGLLRMAEELQEGLEIGSQRFLTNSLVMFVMLLAGIGGLVATAFLVTNIPYKILSGALATIFVLVTAFILTRSQTKFQLHLRRDRNALNEVLKILQEVEPVLRATSDWSRLDEAAFRIRLSRFGVGRSSEAAFESPAKAMGKFTRTMRFLLDEKNAFYRQFVEKIFRNIDVAVKNVMDASSFDDVLIRADLSAEIVGDDVDFNKIVQGSRVALSGGTEPTVSVASRLIGGQWGGMTGGYALFDNGPVVMNKTAKRSFDASQEQLRIQLANVG